MSPNVRRDLVVGGAISAMGIGLLAFALFAGEDSFRAPRWVVGAIALGCLAAAAMPLKSLFGSGELKVNSARVGAAIAAALLILGAVAVWVMVAVGPEARRSRSTSRCRSPTTRSGC
jgi:hypothetical protein